MWDFFDIAADGRHAEVLADAAMPGARWFPGTRLNYAEHALRHGEDDTVAVTAVSEDGTTTRTTWAQLRGQVAALARWLRETGVRCGDRPGAPLPAQSYQRVRNNVGSRVQVASTNGGTNVVSGFAGSAPTTEVWAGEISAPLLGVALEAWNTDGQPVTGEVGELVVTQPMPSMPLSFWNDPDGKRYRDAYFSAYPGVWRHGDWMLTTERGSVIISGRSDSTLNRHGVRLGSADIYDVIDKLPQVSEALVIGAELGDGAYWLVLFIVLADRAVLTGELTRAIKAAIAAQASPRHVPDDIIAVPAIPHTRTGKKQADR